MGLQLIPIAVGTAVGVAAAYVITDRGLRSRIADKSLQFGRRVGGYFTGRSVGETHTEPVTPAYAAQQQYVWQPDQSFTGLSANDDAEHQAPPPPEKPDQHRCEAITKAGNRCRSKTHAIVSMPRGSGEIAEVALCSVHSGIHEEGGAVTLADSE